MQEYFLWRISGCEHTNLNDVSSVTDPVNGQTSFSYDANGNLTGVTDANSHTTSYTYDPTGRLATALTKGSTAYPQWGLSFVYDRYGNRTEQNVAAGSAPSNCLNVSVTTNRITDTCVGGSGILYDANGNMTNDGQNALVYDAVNRMTGSNGSLGSGTYGYDGKGHRVEKVAAGVTTVYIYSGSKVIAEYLNGASPSSPTTEYIYGGSALVAKIQSTAVTYYHQDQESNRIVTNSSGAITEQLGAFPFGEPWYNTTQEKWLFTSYERDMESQNDYAMNRYYVNRLGRFSSADSAGGSSTDPQSLNRFSYAGNDPVNQIDPSGAVTIVLFNFGGGGGDFWACLYSTDFGCDSEYSEFDNIGVIATGELYWSSGVNTDFEDYQADGQLQNKVAEGEIVDLGPVTIYGSVDLSVGQNGPGGPPQPNVLQNAIKRALEALSDPKCVQSLFRSDVDPTYLLNQLVNGTLGSIAIGDLGGVSGGGVFAGVTTAIDEPYVNAGIPTASITGANVTISGNAASPFFSGYPSNPYGPYGNDVGQAVTIIHELGHVANDLYGAGASALLGDQDNPALSAINSILVINGCFGGPK